jgi:hypothetical protein
MKSSSLMSFCWARCVTGTEEGLAARRVLDLVETTGLRLLLVGSFPARRVGDACCGRIGAGMHLKRLLQKEEPPLSPSSSPLIGILAISLQAVRIII